MSGKSRISAKDHSIFSKRCGEGRVSLRPDNSSRLALLEQDSEIQNRRIGAGDVRG